MRVLLQDFDIGKARKPFPNLALMKLLQSYGVDIYPMIYKDASGKEPNVKYNFKENLEFHGARGNLRKFLRITGRLK